MEIQDAKESETPWLLPLRIMDFDNVRKNVLYMCGHSIDSDAHNKLCEYLDHFVDGLNPFFRQVNQMKKRHAILEMHSERATIRIHELEQCLCEKEKLLLRGNADIQALENKLNQRNMKILEIKTKYRSNLLRMHDHFTRGLIPEILSSDLHEDDDVNESCANPFENEIRKFAQYLDVASNSISHKVSTLHARIGKLNMNVMKIMQQMNKQKIKRKVTVMKEEESQDETTTSQQLQMVVVDNDTNNDKSSIVTDNIGFMSEKRRKSADRKGRINNNINDDDNHIDDINNNNINDNDNHIDDINNNNINDNVITNNKNNNVAEQEYHNKPQIINFPVSSNEIHYSNNNNDKKKHTKHKRYKSHEINHHPLSVKSINHKRKGSCSDMVDKDIVCINVDVNDTSDHNNNNQNNKPSSADIYKYAEHYISNVLSVHDMINSNVFTNNKKIFSMNQNNNTDTSTKSTGLKHNVFHLILSYLEGKSTINSINNQQKKKNNNNNSDNYDDDNNGFASSTDESIDCECNITPRKKNNTTLKTNTDPIIDNNMLKQPIKIGLFSNRKKMNVLNNYAQSRRRSQPNIEYLLDKPQFISTYSHNITAKSTTSALETDTDSVLNFDNKKTSARYANEQNGIRIYYEQEEEGKATFTIKNTTQKPLILHTLRGGSNTARNNHKLSVSLQHHTGIKPSAPKPTRKRAKSLIQRNKRNMNMCSRY